ncbi:MAG: KEOPS complex subunit Pcc1 [Candidatus Bathyarchaeia archaeon]
MNIEKVEAKIELRFKSRRYLGSLLNALKPEASSIPTYRSKIEVFALNNVLKLKINSIDIIALRAAINSYLRFILSCYKTLDTIKELE